MAPRRVTPAGIDIYFESVGGKTLEAGNTLGDIQQARLARSEIRPPGIHNTGITAPSKRFTRSIPTPRCWRISSMVINPSVLPAAQFTTTAQVA